MTGRVHTHQLVATRPVDMQDQLFADCGSSLPFCRNMNDFVLVFAGDSRRYLDAGTVSALKNRYPGWPPEVA